MYLGIFLIPTDLPFLALTCWKQGLLSWNESLIDWLQKCNAPFRRNIVENKRVEILERWCTKSA